jgi:Ribbon-helix-helix protein, copG family
LTASHPEHMGFHMKTTLEIDETVMRELKARAARDGTTISELVESALRLLLRKEPKLKDLPPLPTWRGGSPLVDVADRGALHDAMDEDDPWIRDLRKGRER